MAAKNYEISSEQKFKFSPRDELLAWAYHNFLCGDAYWSCPGDTGCRLQEGSAPKESPESHDD